MRAWRRGGASAPPALRESAGEAGREACSAGRTAAPPPPPLRPQGGASAPSRRPGQTEANRVSRRSRSPKHVSSACASFRSTARATRSCARSTGCKAWVARAIDLGAVAIDVETDEHRSDAGRALRHLARARPERGLLRAARPSQRRRRRQRRPVRGRHRARSDRGAGGARRPASRCSRTAACSRSATTSSSPGRSSRCAASRSRLRRHHADVLRARRRARPTTASTRSPRAISITPRSTTTR